MDNLASRGSSTAQKQITESVHRYGCRLLQELATEDDAAENIFVSPFSLSVAMAVLYGGASGDSVEEFGNFLGTGSVAEVNQEFRKLINYTQGICDSKSVKLATSLWLDESIFEQVKDDFLNQATESYSASLYPCDFESIKLPAEVNDWASRVTEGRINNLVHDLRNNRSLVVNAIFFAGTWKNPFSSDHTREGKFDTISSGEIDCLMMNQTDLFLYNETDSSQLVFLEYATGVHPTAMAICLPKRGFSLKDSFCDFENIYGLQATSAKKKVELSMPKFSVEYGSKLAKVLAKLGFNTVFDPELARFDNFCSGFYLGEVVHKAKLEVDEEGSVAAAATAIAAYGGGFFPGLEYEHVLMTVDKPFFVSILDIASQSTLFLGAITKPEPLCTV